MRKLSLAMMGIATAALMTMVSCRKPVNGLVTPGEARTVTFTATTESNDGSKTSVSDHDILWKEGDKISVNGEEMTLASGAGSKSGTFTGTITTAEEYYIGYPAATTTYTSPNTLKLGIPSSWTYDANNVVVPMAAYTTEEGDISFKNAVNVLKLNLNGDNTNASKLTSIVLTHATANLSGDITVEFKDGKPEFSYATGWKHAIVNFSGAGLQLISTTTPVYIVLPKIESGDIKVTFFCANGKCMERTIPWDDKLKEVNYLVSNGTPLTVNATIAPLFVPGDFTVSAGADGVAGTTDDVKVLFSRGNLWYGEKGESKTKTWNLEDNQWDFKFTGEDDECYWDLDHVSHFFWSNTDDWNTSPYEPYAYEYNYSCRNISDIFFTNATQTTPNSDFTVEGQTGWRTLSSAEWEYLVSKREKASDLRGFKTIEGVYGLVLLPDDRNEKVSEIELAEDLIAANAVFLPAAGLRNFEAKIDNIGQQLHYWSSTPDVEDENYAMGLYGDDSENEPEIKSEERQVGRCIRLVK